MQRAIQQSESALSSGKKVYNGSLEESVSCPTDCFVQFVLTAYPYLARHNGESLSEWAPKIMGNVEIWRSCVLDWYKPGNRSYSCSLKMTKDSSGCCFANENGISCSCASETGGEPQHSNIVYCLSSFEDINDVPGLAPRLRSSCNSDYQRKKILFTKSFTHAHLQALYPTLSLLSMIGLTI